MIIDEIQEKNNKYKILPIVSLVTSEIGISLDELLSYNNTLIFTANNQTFGKELWKSDGTRTGTQMIQDINSGPVSSNPTEITLCNNTLFFNANNGISGAEIWKSNGTITGTHLIKDINLAINEIRTKCQHC